MLRERLRLLAASARMFTAKRKDQSVEWLLWALDGAYIAFPSVESSLISNFSVPELPTLDKHYWQNDASITVAAGCRIGGLFHSL